jgi:hypothetical protein
MTHNLFQEYGFCLALRIAQSIQLDFFLTRKTRSVSCEYNNATLHNVDALLPLITAVGASLCNNAVSEEVHLRAAAVDRIGMNAFRCTIL